MPAKDKVNIRWQIIFMFVPGLNVWATYRIRKLRYYLLIIGLPIGVLYLVSPFLLGYNDYYEDVEWNACIEQFSIKYCDETYPEYRTCEPNWYLFYFVNTCDPLDLQIFNLILLVIEYLISIFVIYRWSNLWNQSFDETNFNNRKNPWN